ncbi:hypothetical protein SAMN05216281_1278 [Cryobacterium luteum]|nr:hypothetical protein SAMN05216281_1278 [Cryobacterium luteum]
MTSGQFIRPTWDDSTDCLSNRYPTGHTIHPFVAGQTFIALDGCSGGACNAGHLLPAQVEWRATSRKCKCGSSESRTNVGVIASDAGLVRDSGMLFERDWWHATFSPPTELFAARATFALHVGTEFAAEIRARALFDDSRVTAEEVEVFTYRLRLQRGTPVANDIFIDSPLDDPEHRLAILAAGHGVARYLNRREDVGSISLVGDVGNFTRVGESRQLVLNPYSEKATLRRRAPAASA